MKIRTLCTLAALLWMALAAAQGGLVEIGWNDVAGLARLARHHCHQWHWQAVLAALLLWHLLARAVD